MNLSPEYLFKIRQRLELKKKKAAHDAFVRDQRAEILEILYMNVPKIENNKKRTEAIMRIADKIVELIYG